MKLKSALVGTVALVAFAAGAQAGPSIRLSIGTGGGCYGRPTFCPPQPICRAPVYPAYYAPVVYYNQAPVYYGNTARFSTVSGFVNGGQGFIQVSRPVLPVQPVTVYQGSPFRWR